MRLVCCLVLVLGGLQLACAHLRVGAWNIKQFGPKKANLPGALKTAINANKPKKDHRDPTPQEEQKAKDILEFIAEVIRQYDVILIQEVIDNPANVPVITALMNEVNRGLVSPQYDKVFSEPLCHGDCGHKERYLYIYKMSTVSIVPATDTHQYRPVPLRNTFTRPPFIARFRSIVHVNPPLQFVLIPQHTKPGRAGYGEIDALVDVVRYITYPPPIGSGPQNILLLGDFNAGGTYVTKTDWNDIRLRTQTNEFHWLIDDTMNTAVSRRAQGPALAYDRIVANDLMMQRVARGGNTPRAGPVQFDLQWGLPNDPTSTTIPKAKIPAEDISDHFIVEVYLQ